MCYRDNVPPLSLEGVHVACLCGDNGSGKSALLDAMTWALWGKSRAESDDDLVHEGQGDMEVDLEFSAQGRPYRVLRKHAKGPAGRSGSTLLTLQTGANGNYTDISGNTKTETQQKLIDILRLDYKTFRNSAYLAQGKANEFTLADPAERKKVLAAILDLSQYDELSERAKAQAVEKNNMASRLEDLIARMDSELSSKQQNLADLAQLEVLLADVETARVAAEATMTGLMQQYQSLEIKRSQLKDLESHQPQLREDLSRWAKRFTDINQQIAEYEKMEAERATIKEGYELFSRLDSENRTFNEKAQRLLGLASNISRLEMAVERAQNDLVSEHRALQKKLEGLQKLADSIPKLELDLSEVQAELKALGTLEESLTDKRRSAITLVTQIENLRSGAERLSAEVKQLENKLNLLSAHGAKCPLCETELGEDGLERVRKSYQTERTGKMDSIKANTEQVQEHSVQRGTLEAEIARVEPAVKSDKADRQSKLGKLLNELAAAREAVAATTEDGNLLTTLEERLAARDFATAEQKALAELQAQAAFLAYDAGLHEQVRRRLQEASEFQRKWIMLDDALRRLPQARLELRQADDAVASLRQRIQSDQQRMQDWAQETSVMPDLAGSISESRKTCEGMVSSEKMHRERLAAVQERLRRVQELEKERTTKAKEASIVSEEENTFRFLSDAFGKKGIQALIIEQKALPEIEAEANRLLKRMTDNRMSITIKTQALTKKGSTVETLEIQIGDELGTRNYDMFSGGEAFRIDFALRIALSRLLTHRAGASLSTLFIDEGFGTQDTSGRERLVEVINSIQDEFDKIIVITHLEELKEAFPLRIDVSKTPQGSIISVN